MAGLGILPAAAVTWLIVGLLLAGGTSWESVVPLLLTALTGGLGAIVSVLQRMTSGTLALEPDVGRRLLTIVGAVRPLLGALLGGILYVLLFGEVINLNPPNGVPSNYWYAGLAFFAGFSERFAQDMLSLGAAPLSTRIERAQERREARRERHRERRQGQAGGRERRVV